MLACKLGIVLIMAQRMMYGSGYDWYTVRGTKLPCGSPLWAGWGEKKDNIYIGRAWYDGNLLPAKVMPKNGRAYVGLNGQEYWTTTYQVLCGSRSLWEKASYGNIPKYAFPVGKTAHGTPLYYGRAHIGNGLHPGKIDGQKKGILIPLNGREHLVSRYEVLVEKRTPWLG